MKKIQHNNKVYKIEFFPNGKYFAVQIKQDKRGTVVTTNFKPDVELNEKIKTLANG